MNNALEANSLSINRSGKPVLNDISFTVPAGEIYALLGGNGAGKSTTLLTFLGFLEAASGSVSVQGEQVNKNVKKAREAIAYLPEAATLYGHMSAYENLRYFLDLANAKASDSELNEALDSVALQTAARSQHMVTYSKGMRQKTAIALAILRDSPILLLDEPTSGLDPLAIDEFNRLARKLADQGRTILMVTHDVYGACQVADRIGLLRRGKLVGAFDRTEGEIDTETVHRAFAERAST